MSLGPALVAAGVLALGCGAQRDDAPAPLDGQDCLLILLDALHSQQLGCYGNPRPTSPHLDALAAEGLRFERAWSNASWTLPSVVSLFTGMYQETHGVQFGLKLEDVKLDEHATTLAELFAAAGYRTAFFNQSPFAGPRYGLTQGFEDYRQYYWHSGHQLVDEVVAYMGEPAGTPRFTYVHVRKPHTPFDAPADLRRVFIDPDYEGSVQGTEDEIAAHNGGSALLEGADLQRHVDLYAANIREADDTVGSILAAVDRSRTLVIVLSDHGEAVGQHGALGHNWRSFEEYTRIPLLMAHPSLPTQAVIDAPVSSVDVLPTIVELFGLTPPEQPRQGSSLVPLLAGGTLERPAIFTSARRMKEAQDLAVIDGRWKLIRTQPRGTEQLFDLVADPGETRNLLQQHPEEAERLRALLLDWVKGQRPLYAATSEGLDDESLDELRRLGYVK